jgi:hypothetical protein
MRHFCCKPNFTPQNITENTMTIDDDFSDDDVPNAEKEQFEKELYGFMERRGTPIPDKLPQLGKRRLDLHRLYKEVSRRGGYQAVCSNSTLSYN